VAAHTVEYKHQCRVLGNDDGSPVLIVGTVTQRGDFGVFDLHVCIAVY
jgi:hypothetical protein